MSGNSILKLSGRIYDLILIKQEMTGKKSVTDVFGENCYRCP
jgi:hypothetical protein